MMGGNIEVMSILGEGSEFSFTVDLVRDVFAMADGELPNFSEGSGEKDAEFPNEQKPGSVDDFSRRRILLAEDVDINREIVASMLESTNIEIECAENGAIAVSKYTEDPKRYDMIFMDIQMPEMDGYEATKRIRALEEWTGRHVPIIAMTANVFREDIEKSIAAGMDSHVGKPVDFVEVLSQIRTYLRRT
jgi:CheY-like chemotaxis protein